MNIVFCDGFLQGPKRKREYLNPREMTQLHAAANDRGHRVIWPNNGANWNSRKAYRTADRILDGKWGHFDPDEWAVFGFSDGGKAAIKIGIDLGIPFVAYGISRWRKDVDPQTLRVPCLFVANDLDKITREKTAASCDKFADAWGAEWVAWQEIKDEREGKVRKLHRHWWLPSANGLILDWMEGL